MLMTTPLPLATISRAAAWATRNAALTLSPRRRSRVASSTSRKGCGRLSPAKASRTASERVTSKGSACALPPRESISRATSSNWLGVRLTSTSSAPAAANARATARPMPRPAPVTSAVLPSRRKALSSATSTPDLSGVGFEQAPHLRAGLGPPARVEIAKPRPEAGSIGGVDLHVPAREFFRAGGVDLFDVRALQQGEFLGVTLDHFLDDARQGGPRRGIGE